VGFHAAPQARAVGVAVGVAVGLGGVRGSGGASRVAVVVDGHAVHGALMGRIVRPARGSMGHDLGASMSRAASRSVRLNRLRERLQLGPVGVMQLARELSVTRRTIERDLITLRDDLGEAVVVDAQHRYRLGGGPSFLNAVEALATYSAVRLLQHTGVGERHYRSSMVKLAQSLPEPARGVLLRRVAVLVASPDDRVLDLVAQAWFEQRVLRCRYQSAASAEPGVRDLEIYFFELNRRNHEPYVIAFDRSKRRQTLVFKLARMRDVHLLAERYEPPADFDADRQLANSFGIVLGEQVVVELLLTPQAAKRFAEGADSAVELLGPQPDGRTAARLHGTLDADGNALELIPWLLGWGDAVEVISPPEVRAAVMERLSTAWRQYAAAGEGAS
jgi:predicted DNA-binding transcriptional regulator YafY